MKKLLKIAILWQTLIGLSEQTPKTGPRNCGPIRTGVINFHTDSRNAYQDKTGIDVQLIDNGNDHSIVIDGSYKGIMIIAMDKSTKKSTGSFKLSSLNLKRHRLLKCYLPRDALRHLSDRNMKSGTSKFDWDGRCGPNVRFYVFTTTSTNSSVNYLPSRNNPWLWNKLELPCSQSKGFKAHLDEIVQLKSVTSSITSNNYRNKSKYPRSWSKNSPKPSYSTKSSPTEEPSLESRSRLYQYQWGEWQQWGKCSSKCGPGSKSRRRTCMSTIDGRPVANTQCPGAVIDMVDCETGDCPEWNDWGAWSTCSRTCGEGLTTRRRYCLFGGPCPGEKEEKKACNTNKCDRDQMKYICKDKYPYCNKWKKQGYCQDTFSTWMVANCRYTCGRCQKDNVVPECKDTYEQSCWRWKQDGKCESGTQQIRAFVRTKCKKSCGNCGFNE